MTHGERRAQIGSWPAIEEAVKQGMELRVWWSVEEKRFKSFLLTKREFVAIESGNNINWALDHLENELNDEP